LDIFCGVLDYIGSFPILEGVATVYLIYPPPKVGAGELLRDLSFALAECLASTGI
jgi:hypothetical protein